MNGVDEGRIPAGTAPSEGTPSRPYTPALHAEWLLRATGIVCVAASLTGVIVVPGARGVAGDTLVRVVTQLGRSLAYFMAMLVITLIVLACVELSRSSRLRIAPRVVAMGAAGAVIAFASPSTFVHLPPPVSFALGVAATAVVCAAASVSLRDNRTRAVAVVALSFAVAAVLRLGAWEMASVAGDRANMRLYGFARWMATSGVALEALGQMTAAAWLGTRSRVMGQGLSSLAIGGAFVLTWGAARGSSVTAAPWQAALHGALADAPGLPPPFLLSALAIFLICASILLALVSALQMRQIGAVVAALALTLIGRGAFDVPLRALAAAGGGLWMMVALMDDKALWKALIEQRERKLEDERAARIT